MILAVSQFLQLSLDILILDQCLIAVDIQAVVEIGNRFWAHQNWHPNFDELISQKNLIKPHKLKKCQ